LPQWRINDGWAADCSFFWHGRPQSTVVISVAKPDAMAEGTVVKVQLSLRPSGRFAIVYDGAEAPTLGDASTG